MHYMTLYGLDAELNQTQGVECVGWLLFMVFAGVGLVAFPLDLFREFVGRPRATITHSE